MSRIDCLREELGGPHPLAAKKVKPFLEPYVRAFIEHAPFAVMASSNANGDCDASPKGGHPGFVKVIDDRTLLIPDIGGNRLFQSYQNFESNPKAGFVFIIPGMDMTVRVNGRVSVIEPAELERRGLVAEVKRSFQFAELWNTGTIEANLKRSLKDLKASSDAKNGVPAAEGAG
jgi:predicted pyridoxine 5'-phosphate oxidase superfamily flavin-nucleotide-binding protein